MKIFLDGRIPGGGIGRHVRWLRRGLADQFEEGACIVYGDGSEDGRPTSRRSILRRGAGALKRIGVDQWIVPRLVTRSGADLFHSPNYLVPERLSIPAVVDCYDLTLIDQFRTKKRGPVKFYERREFRGALERARHVVTPSHAVRQTVVDRFRLDPNKVTTIYPALPDLSGGIEDCQLPAIARGPFFLTVGTLEPRKNLEFLIEAHRTLWGETQVPLVLVGSYGWRQQALLRAIGESRGAVHWLGWVPDDLLGTLYRRSVAVVQPSLAEGFDLPALEAMAVGAPLVLSDIAVHREVAGALGLYTPAGDAELLEERMREVLQWSRERRSIWGRGARARAATLASHSGIERYLAVYRQALDG